MISFFFLRIRLIGNIPSEITSPLHKTKINRETSQMTFSEPPQLLQDIFFFLRYREVETQFEIQTGILGFKYLS